MAPLLIDSGAGRIYAPARTAGGAQARTAVLSAADGRLLKLYDVGGPLGLDAKNGRLYVDLGEAGLAVLNPATGDTLRTIALPAALEWPAGGPAPQADPATGQVFAMRNNSVYVIDGNSGQVLHNIDFDLRPQDNCSSPHDGVLPIAGSRYDPESRILYLDFITYQCTPYVGYTVVSYDVAAGKELGRGGASPFQATAGGGRQFVSDWYRMGGGTLTLWLGGRPAVTSTDWNGGAAAPHLDARRKRVYQNGSTGMMRVFDADSMRLLMVRPSPAPGQLAGYDPTTDQLYFLENGRLRVAPAARLAEPTAQPPVAVAAPAGPLNSLALSPDYGGDKTMFAIFPFELPTGNCFVFSPVGGRMLASSDGGQNWRLPQAGLPGDCAYVTAFALSPGYAADHTVLAAVEGNGLFKSTDGGALWLPASAGLPSMSIRQVLLSPGYARDQTAFVFGQSGGLQRSADGGRTWTRVGELETVLLAALSPEFEQDGTLVALGYPKDAPARLLISRDRGQRWESLASPQPASAGLPGLSLAPSFARWQVMFATDDAGTLYRSGDGGKNWQMVLSSGVSGPLGVQIAYGPGETNRPVFLLLTSRVAGAFPTDPTSKLFRSRDGGGTWQQVDLGSDTEPTAMALSPSFEQDGLLFLGTAGGRVVTVKGLELPALP